MESSYIAEKSHSEGKNSPESCLINLLRNDLSGKVVINDGSTMNSTNDKQKVPAEGHYIEKYQDDEEDEDNEEDGDDFSDEELLARMGYGKSEPNRVIKKEHRKQYYDDDEDEDEEDDNLLEESLFSQMGYLKKEPPKHEPISTPTAALNLVSALKGSREKEGKQAMECRVSWAPDVYDPPSSTENFATTDPQRHKIEHKVKGLAGKNRQKMGGKGVRGPEDGGGGGGCKGSKVGGNKGTVGGGGRKAGVKYKDRKQVKKKHGGSASKYSNFDDG